MGIFSKNKGVVCAVCKEELGRQPNMLLHNLNHVIPSPDGGSGFGWRCGCGEVDGVWDQQAGAAAGLTDHMQKRHGLLSPF
jgi:hypothetical protein